MPISSKPFELLDESDLQSLVSNQRLENKTIEYKESLPDNSDSDKKEFLAEISSFANAAGGDLIFGIGEIDGIPSELCGLELTNVDAEKLRLESIIRDGIDPRIPVVSIRDIPLQTRELKVAIVIRVPRSWALPHMVTFKGHSRFYSRNSAGKYPLDVSDIRALFALSETTAERIRNFRLERLSKIISGETPVALDEVPKIILHIIPFGAFDPAAKFDVSSLVRDTGLLQPMSAPNWSHRHNFDGLLTYGQYSISPYAYTYLQIFRNGIIEAVNAFLLSDGSSIPSQQYEKGLLDGLKRFFSIQKKLGVEPPLFIMLTLLGVAGYTMAVDRARLIWHSDYPIDRDSLLIPEVMVENFECDPAEVMRPAFDAVWNAAGWPRSMNYDDEGKWTGQQTF